MVENALTLRDVEKQFGRSKVLKGVNLTVKKGEIYGLIGANGAGKSTIMRMVTGLSPTKVGEITLLGQKLGNNYQQSLRRTGSIIESPTFYKNLSVKQNLMVIAKQKGLVNAKKEVEEVINFVGLTAKYKSKSSSLSLGQRQRLGLGIALLGNPDFLILDEPINGLDPSGIIEFRKLLQDLNHNRQTTILISSHILSELYQVATTFGFIHGGEVIEEISKAELDRRNQSGLVITVDNTDRAAQVLDQLHINKFQVLSTNNLIIYNTDIDTAQINKTLINADVTVSSIEEREGSLEDYYTRLISNAEQAKVEVK
ncbi:ATP-binding cassette domain-containing protein [Pediococcus argentinicus]|uniref:ABC transporter ATP-binding protein n=1 Tax=Pediococcus argentinicus TaxID=480391 RepID=A0A0R2NJC9_9LACO|nr:ABC transporter ATP-binding protein [Pediococcus argentinicus]KRO25880.1 ABC transporter ATP-binding protein [Pediococcus argentinicus]NKZ21873.1 ABC transporter ATP-binding protein [Pediococcus argentinicus]GEP19043.1 ABC transporter [Pediococcus argentinicus]